jgi:hypothetical protein
VSAITRGLLDLKYIRSSTCCCPRIPPEISGPRRLAASFTVWFNSDISLGKALFYRSYGSVDELLRVVAITLRRSERRSREANSGLGAELALGLALSGASPSPDFRCQRPVRPAVSLVDAVKSKSLIRLQNSECLKTQGVQFF